MSDHGERLHALVVSYGFPPVGGAGVQRVVKLVKYLPAFQVVPSVLTAKQPSVPLLDESFASDLPPELEIQRTRTFEPGYAIKQAAWRTTAAAGVPRLSQRLKRPLLSLARNLLIPDAQILWQPTAQAALASRLLREPPDVLFISGPPFSQFLLAPLARLSSKTAVVLDYRDEWSTYRSAYEMSGRAAGAIGAVLEHALFRTADAVTTATEAFREELLRRYAFLDPARVQTIPNGYDPDDFPAQLATSQTTRLTLGYAGTVFKLTSARGLMRGIQLLAERTPNLAERMEVRFIGRIVDTEQDAFEGMELHGVRKIDYVPHGRLLELLDESHVTLCILDDVPGVERIYPGKIFELMYLRRPCLVLAPEGALTELVRRHGLGRVVAPGDATAIANELERLLTDFEQGVLPERIEPIDIGGYARKELAGRFAQVFAEAVAQRKEGSARSHRASQPRSVRVLLHE